ncbi:3-methyladenine DNA glycosylase [Sphingobium sp. SCG-1]|uniref:DNA-3-methyladenine glycosylase I n=1 Tax=Sphingobium sp. SCG-1 TaxID=2072936 RepID=UPI000CD6C491|nr:DNA-3-methyladenine glycosylase I [Sphingobium sp. SCG-1]AUW59280.1 3-methyladenine DNA glycosylase [Sphingobium sp. SCG-1]
MSSGDAPHVSRCAWAGTGPLYCDYHDQEWGIAECDSRALWECLMLEGFQAGLSWIAILRKRENFRRAFAGFVPETVARFGEAEVARLMQDGGIIRARAKIEAAIAGARIFVAMREAGEDFATYCWSFTDGQVLSGDGITLPAKSALSEAISKDMKARGFKFVGPTIVYAWMQAVGIVDDHAVTCFRRGQA